jgi:hypothetical protein
MASYHPRPTRSNCGTAPTNPHGHTPHRVCRFAFQFHMTTQHRQSDTHTGQATAHSHPPALRPHDHTLALADAAAAKPATPTPTRPPRHAAAEAPSRPVAHTRLGTGASRGPARCQRRLVGHGRSDVGGGPARCQLLSLSGDSRRPVVRRSRQAPTAVPPRQPGAQAGLASCMAARHPRLRRTEATLASHRTTAVLLLLDTVRSEDIFKIIS